MDKKRRREILEAAEYDSEQAQADFDNGKIDRAELIRQLHNVDNNLEMDLQELKERS